MALSLYTSIFNYSIAQDSTHHFFSYIFKTPWIVDAGISLVDNNGKRDPFKMDLQMKPYYNTERVNYYPTRFAVEKRLFLFSNKNFLKGFSLQAAISRHGLQPINFGAIDGNVKYHFNVLMGEAKMKKWFDPYLATGAGVSEFFYDQIKSPKNVAAPTAKGYQKAVEHRYSRDRFLTLNTGVGCDFWITKVVGINLQADAKWHWLERSLRDKRGEGTNYTQYTVGLVFKIGGCKKVGEENDGTKKPASNYKRSKEEEDAIIHLREHLNK